MNIFVLHNDPVIAAQMQCDKHVVKMILESGQMLSTAHHVLYKEETFVFYSGVIPKKTHENHPCAIWTRENESNYDWLCQHFHALLSEYTYRYNKMHKWECYRSLFSYLPKNIKRRKPLTTHPLCMPDEYKTNDVVQSYRNYYIGDKVSFAKWNKTRKAPEWWDRVVKE